MTDTEAGPVTSNGPAPEPSETFTDIADVLTVIRERVPEWPGDFENRLDEPLTNVFGHLQLQVLFYAVKQAKPDISRAALADPSTDGATLLYWLESLVGQPRTLRRRDRHDYRSSGAHLRPLTESDVMPLYHAALNPADAHRWRFRGRTPSPEMFHHSLFNDNVLAQYMVWANEPVAPVALVSAYAADLVSGHCYLAVQRSAHVNRGEHRGVPLEGALLFISYLFDHFDLVKIYLEVPEYNDWLVAGAAKDFLRLEGQLRGHYLFSGERYDQSIYALYKEDWDPIADLFKQ